MMQMSAFANNFSNTTVPDINKILIAVFPALLTLLTVIGNSIVILVIVVDRKLFHKQSSLLIMNLAVADLLVGTVVMPLALMMLLTDGNWPLGFEMCRFWISMDVICSTASIVTLCVISVQRLHAIMNPLACITSRSRGKIWFSIAIIWLYSVAVLLICLKYDTEVETKDIEVCFVGYQLNHLLLSVMLSFYIPLLLIIVVSCKITLLLNARHRNLATKRQSRGTGLRIHYGSDESTSGIQKALAKQQSKTYRTLAYLALLCNSKLTRIVITHKLCFTRRNSFELGGCVHLAWIQQQHLQCGHLCGKNERFCSGMQEADFSRRTSLLNFYFFSFLFYLFIFIHKIC
ncbi:5-hydroxytryptamine receptor 1B [Trichinella pseudospiralis]|uniref:5-hydroxytryptamine receptor 1B n=1 Tax=Trichinella pseudospiralis TaxID=6337 RepID=A0A0V0YEL2_TRIPS|nr:5-hydroxytryptamine receptor 1B [Trichinella pseudospiralis]